MKVFHEDAGHGWLAVKRSELISLGILDKISHYSYERGASVYLEEDCDLEVYMLALKAIGIDIKEFWAGVRKSYVDRSPVRSYKSFSA